MLLQTQKKSKLSGIAANANVGITDVVGDTTPQLGGDLDMNSKSISSGVLGIKNTGSQSELRLYCEVSNAHYIAVKAPPHNQFSGNPTFQLPPNGGTNNYLLKTNGSGVTTWTAPYSISSDLLDEDNMATDSATKVPSQQSVKAFSSNASNLTSGTIPAARVPTLNQDTTGTAAGLTGSPNITVGTIGCGNVTGTGTVSDSKGDLRSIPLNTQSGSGNYDLVAADAGKTILASGNVTIADSIFSGGDAVTIINNTNADITINKGSVLYYTADGTSANRTLATRGMATIYFTHNTTAYISGAGLS